MKYIPPYLYNMEARLQQQYFLCFINCSQRQAVHHGYVQTGYDT